MHNLTIEKGHHSSKKDHTLMTGGTLTLDKVISSDTAFPLHYYYVPLETASTELSQFHQGVHSLEHMLAYSPESGSIRYQLSQLSSRITGNEVLDISPYRTLDERYGFRITSAITLPSTVLDSAIHNGLYNASSYLQTHADIPFATAEQCGQYNFHSNEAAQHIAQAMLTKNVTSKELPQVIPSDSSKEYYVCDLRLLKPRLEGNEDQITLNPEASYMISNYLERNLHRFFQLGYAPSFCVGTFGCMTGMYLAISNNTELPSHEFLPLLHICITSTLAAFIDESANETVISNTVLSLAHIAKYNPNIYKSARISDNVKEQVHRFMHHVL